MPRAAGWARRLALPAGIALVAGFAAWILVSARSGALAPELQSTGGAIGRLRELISLHPSASVLLFAATHVVVSFLSLPGCTILNLLAGAGFGFWKGVLTVYPATLASAALGYAAGRALGRSLAPRLPARLREPFEKACRRLKASDGPESEGFLFLVGLRLSPLFPFGILNLVLGMVRVPFPTYFLSTLAGIFFDVFLLNLIGSQLGARLGSPSDARPALETTELLPLALSFAALVGASLWLRGYFSRRSKNI